MSRFDPVSIMVGLIMVILSPFLRVCDRFISGILALGLGIAGIIWTCYVTIPMAIGDFTDKIQIAQFILNFLQGIDIPNQSQGILQPISPFFGLIGVVIGLVLLYHFRYEILSVLRLA